MPVFDYEDIQLVPNKCIVKSRSEIDTRVKFGPMTFNIPVVPANMQTVIDEDLAIWLDQHHIEYEEASFEWLTRGRSALDEANAQGVDPKSILKTIVLQANKDPKDYVVVCLPLEYENLINVKTEPFLIRIFFYLTYSD